MTIGLGALYSVGSAFAAGEGAGLLNRLKGSNGEAITPFTFAHLSDTHVGFNGPPDPLGTKAFESAVAQVNALRPRPELVLFSGDLSHDTDDTNVHADRMKLFKTIAGGLKVPKNKIKVVPGENDASLDGGVLFREHFGDMHYSFDHRGVHFVALDNVSLGKPAVGTEQLAWLKADLARFPKTAPIVVFTHRPLFDLKPEWEWFTSDGDDVMNALAPYENVTVLYGHIHRRHIHTASHVTHYAARSLIFAFPDITAPQKKPAAFDKDHPFKDLGIRVVNEQDGGALALQDVELTIREYAGTVGGQQLLKNGSQGEDE